MTMPSDMRMGRVEFVAFCAMLSATVAFSIDSMLPGLPDIAAELSPDAPNRAQMVLTSFVLGMGLGTFIAGPLSDSFGRRRVMVWGALIYCIGAFVAWRSTSLEVMLAARAVQGFGAAGPRIVSMAVIRDLFSGRHMARIMSFVMMVFSLVPAIGPLMGAGIIAISDWRGIFIAFLIFSILSMIWMGLRLPETLPLEKRRSFKPAALLMALQDMAQYRNVRLAILCQALLFGLLFAMLSTVHSIYEITFEREASFPYWFALVSVLAGSASVLNATLVLRLGMRKLVTIAVAVQTAFSLIMLLLSLYPPTDTLYFIYFVFWQTSVFFLAGMTFGNLTALAMEPLGHIAGLAASIIAGVATIAGAVIGALVGQLFAGTPTPLAASSAVLCILATLLMLHLKRLEAQNPAIS